jgi:periplasmic copper chaperone A
MQRNMKSTRMMLASIAVFFILPAATAFGHVGFTPDEVPVDDAALLTMTVPHDCNGKGITSVEVQVPEEVTYFTPVEAPGWTIAVKGGEAHSHSSSEDAAAEHDKAMKAGSTGGAVESVTWTHQGGPLPTGVAAAFQVLVGVDAAAKGSTIHIPAIQNCPGGQSVAWTEVPAKGESHDDLESPAPMISAVAASGGGHMADESESDHSAMKAVAAEEMDHAEDEDVERAQTIAIVGVVLGAIALLIGFIALRRRK